MFSQCIYNMQTCLSHLGNSQAAVVQSMFALHQVASTCCSASSATYACPMLSMFSAYELYFYYPNTLVPAAVPHGNLSANACLLCEISLSDIRYMCWMRGKSRDGGKVSGKARVSQRKRHSTPALTLGALGGTVPAAIYSVCCRYRGK